jgi:hypothetical protein
VRIEETVEDLLLRKILPLLFPGGLDLFGDGEVDSPLEHNKKVSRRLSNAVDGLAFPEVDVLYPLRHFGQQSEVAAELVEEGNFLQQWHELVDQFERPQFGTAALLQKIN